MNKDLDPFTPAELAKTLPPKWRADFLQFLKDGEASPEFMIFLETDKAATVALETELERQSINWEEVGHSLKKMDAPRKPPHKLLESIKDRFNRKLSKPFALEGKFSVRLQDGGIIDIPYSLSLAVRDKETYKSYMHPPEGHLTPRPLPRAAA